jgi:hypothetical protein
MGKRERQDAEMQALVEKMRREAEPLAIATDAFLGDIRRASIRVARDTTYGLGGVSIHITGEGAVTIDKQAFGPHEQALDHKLKLPPADVQALFSAFVIADFARLVIPEHFGVPDEPHYSIELTNAAGQTRRASKFVRCEQPAFERLVSLVGATVRRHLDDKLRAKLTI